MIKLYVMSLCVGNFSPDFLSKDVANSVMLVQVSQHN